MSGTTVVPSVKGTSTLVRPRFAPGMLLQHDDLDQLTTYSRELNRLMFRSLFGCGVVCGLIVEIGEHCRQQCVVVNAGLGIDCTGDPVYVPAKQCVIIDVDCAPNPSKELWVVLCSTTKCCAPRTSMCPSDDDDELSSVCTRERDGFEIRVLDKRPKCVCGCGQISKDEGKSKKEQTAYTEGRTGQEPPCPCVGPDNPCYTDHYDGICSCECGDCTGDCDCILLARLEKVKKDSEHEKPESGNPDWTIDHSVRRFIRPVLMRDPQVAKEKEAAAKKAAKKKSGYAGEATTELMEESGSKLPKGKSKS